jgi:hypothetical protein
MRRVSPLYLSYIRKAQGTGKRGLLNGCGDGVGDAPSEQRTDCNIHTTRIFGEQHPSFSWISRPPSLGIGGLEVKRGEEFEV